MRTSEITEEIFHRFIKIFPIKLYTFNALIESYGWTHDMEYYVDKEKNDEFIACYFGNKDTDLGIIYMITWTEKDYE